MLRAFTLLFGLTALLSAQTRTLDIYWIDVEGGAATLIVAPTGESLLIDTGFPANEDRDPKRIAAAASAAGIKSIDNLVITHYHGDHVGGAGALSKLIPIRRFVDHGESIESTGRGGQAFTDYKAVAEGKRALVKPGDKIPLASAIDITVVSAAGNVITQALSNGGANPLCASAEQKPADTTENGQSVGILLTYGGFRMAALGDLTWDREMQLACPANKLGTVALFQATHHGFSNGQSGAPALINALRPQVVIVNNGPRKGFSNGGYDSIAAIPGIEGIWQGHRGETNDVTKNTADEMIANPAGGAEDKGHWIKASISSNGTFTITNARNNFTRTYKVR
jgi:competence protein ComEC